MYNACVIVISIALSLTSVIGSINLKQPEDKTLSATTTTLLSSFQNCIVCAFHWGLGNEYDQSTPTNYFIFYSQFISCTLIVDTYYTKISNNSIKNHRFTGPYQPHPLFTKYTTTLINLYSSAVTCADFNETPATKYIHGIISKYNMAFNYVLIFMSNARFSSVDNLAMFSTYIKLSIPAVYILILDEREVYVVGFAHVLQSAPYLFRIATLEEAHIQYQHKIIHKDLQQTMVDVATQVSPKLCKFGSPVLLPPNDCAFSTLLEEFNMTYCNTYYSSCDSPVISIMYTEKALYFENLFTRRTNLNLEFINYLVDNHEFSFICIVETGMMGFMAFVQAFNLPMWISTTVTCMCLTVTVTVMSTKNATPWWTKLQPSAVLVIMLLAERFYTNSLLQRAASRQTVLVITLWAFGAMLLGMSYSGNMVSELAAPSLATVPQDMHELSLVRYQIFSSSYRLSYNGSSVYKEGYLHAGINEYLENQPSKTGMLTNDLERLSMGMKFLKTALPKYQPSGRKSSQTLFAYADEPVTLKSVGIRSAMTSSRLRVTPPKNLPFFNSQWQFAIQSNSLLPIFRNFLPKISEPGMLKYWQKGFTYQELKALILEGTTAKKSKSSSKRSWASKLKLAVIWHDLDSLLDFSSSWNPIDVDNLSPAFQLLGICLLMSILVLFNERWPFKVVGRWMIRMGVKVPPAIVRGLLKLRCWCEGQSKPTLNRMSITRFYGGPGEQMQMKIHVDVRK